MRRVEKSKGPGDAIDHDGSHWSKCLSGIFTDHVKLAHIIRKVLLRQIAITNDINPF